MSTILFPCDGAVLTQIPGTPQLPKLLTVQTDAPQGSLVNGIPVDCCGTAVVPVSGTAPKLSLATPEGEPLAEANLRFAAQLCRKYRFTVDDNIQFLEDLTRNQNRYSSIFENPYLAGFYRLHQRFGLKVTLNLFFSYYEDSFSLRDMTARFREEFLANSDWLRFSFHARHNDPPDPYANRPAQEILRDFDDVMEQVVRFAGRRCISDFMTVHYLLCTREACLALQSRGVRGLMGFPSERDGSLTFTGYLEGTRAKQMGQVSLCQDADTGLYFIRNDMVINACPLEEIPGRLNAVEHSSAGTGYFDVMIHEQYFYRDYEAFQPDFFEKLQTVFSWLEQRGYSCVFLDDIL